MKPDEIITKADELIEKIPGHIRDIIAKASLAILAFLALIAIVVGIQWGINDAEPGGMQIAENNRDIFYLQQIREENAKRIQLVEDVENDPMEFESNQTASFRQMGRDTQNNLMGEKDTLLSKEGDELRVDDKRPAFLGDDVFTPQAGRNTENNDEKKLVKDRQDEEILDLKSEQKKDVSQREKTSNQSAVKTSEEKKLPLRFLE